MGSKQYNDYMNKRMQSTPQGKKDYDNIVAMQKKVIGTPKRVAKAVVKKVNGFNTFVKGIRPKITNKLKARMGLK